MPFGSFLLQAALAKGDIHRLVGRLEKSYGALNFRVAIPFTSRRLFIFQEKEPIRAVMRQDARLPYVNKNFDVSHGHFSSINSVDTTDDLWRDLHGELWDIFKSNAISPLMEKYREELTREGTYNLNERLEAFFLKVWSEYCFGDVDSVQFNSMREKLVGTLGKVFHQNRFNRWPLVGRWTSQRNRRRYDAELKEVDSELGAILRGAIAQKKGAFYQLYERLRPKYENAFQITLDNSFLAVLVYDFIYIVTLDALAHIAKDPSLDRAQQFRQSRHDGFLYPFRFREVAQAFDGFRPGDFCVLNLQKSGLYFSSGPRACPGAGLFGEITRKLLEIFESSELCLVHPEQVITNTGNPDLPFMTSSHDVRVSRCPFARIFGKKTKED